MKQYLELLKTVDSSGLYKPAARENMPGTKSLFGYQFRHNLQEGFPLLTTKRIYWKGVVAELLWFLRGDINIKFLVDNNVNIWNEDAYNFYSKRVKQFNQKMIKDFKGTIVENNNELFQLPILSFETFLEVVKDSSKASIQIPLKFWVENGEGYSPGDCGFQYGKVWRRWRAPKMGEEGEYIKGSIDQIKKVLSSLLHSPESRRHLVTALDPAHDEELALYWCHVLFQFNCRPLTRQERLKYSVDHNCTYENLVGNFKNEDECYNSQNIPRYYLDCQLYQRSADSVLGVPFNLASYSLLTHLIAKICNMVPGDFIHTFGDVHIYENHNEAIKEQLGRTPTELPTLKFSQEFERKLKNFSLENLDKFLESLEINDFIIENYNPQSKIKAELSTGMK